jgi:ureidoglycolate hydrolase
MEPHPPQAAQAATPIQAGAAVVVVAAEPQSRHRSQVVQGVMVGSAAVVAAAEVWA